MVRCLFAAAVLALSYAASHAAEPSPTIGLHLGTAHSRAGLCDANPGAYVRLASGATFGAYRNSECRASAYAGHTWATSGRLSFAITAGVVTGYRSRPVGPLVVPSLAIAIPGEGGHLRLSYLPRAEKGGASGLHLSVEWAL